MKEFGQRHVAARFNPDDLVRLQVLTAKFGSEAAALREAVRLAFEALPRREQARWVKAAQARQASHHLSN